MGIEARNNPFEQTINQAEKVSKPEEELVLPNVRDVSQAERTTAGVWQQGPVFQVGSYYVLFHTRGTKVDIYVSNELKFETDQMKESDAAKDGTIVLKDVLAVMVNASDEAANYRLKKLGVDSKSEADCHRILEGYDLL